jgi:hypothetical protein
MLSLFCVLSLTFLAHQRRLEYNWNCNTGKSSSTSSPLQCMLINFSFFPAESFRPGGLLWGLYTEKLLWIQLAFIWSGVAIWGNLWLACSLLGRKDYHGRAQPPRPNFLHSELDWNLIWKAVLVTKVHKKEAQAAQSFSFLPRPPNNHHLHVHEIKRLSYRMPHSTMIFPHCLLTCPPPTCKIKAESWVHRTQGAGLHTSPARTLSRRPLIGSLSPYPPIPTKYRRWGSFYDLCALFHHCSLLLETTKSVFFWQALGTNLSSWDYVFPSPAYLGWFPTALTDSLHSWRERPCPKHGQDSYQESRPSGDRFSLSLS